MASSSPLTIRPWQYRDLEKIADAGIRMQTGVETTQYGTRLEFQEQLQYARQWYGVLKCLQLFPNPLQHFFSTYVAEVSHQLAGFIQVSPFNYTRSTWRVERIAAIASPPPARCASPNPAPATVRNTGNGGFNSSNGAQRPTASTMGTQSEAMAPSPARLPYLSTDITSQLLRYCLDRIWEARTWMVEVGVSDDTTLSLYRHHGFQPLAHNTYWAIAPDILTTLASRSAATFNLRPVSNADAGLLHQLDTVSMPPLVRQVFDRHVSDFQTGLPEASLTGLHRLMTPEETLSGYVFEPQRKAAIGYFRLQVCQDGQQPHAAELTVHPAYTWLYPELLSQMARIVQRYPSQSLQLTSSDYQTEREEYLAEVGATRTQHTLLMSRSVWHKVRETKQVSLESLQLSEMLKGWQPGQKPIPGRFSFDSHHSPSPSESNDSAKDS